MIINIHNDKFQLAQKKNGKIAYRYTLPHLNFLRPEISSMQRLQVWPIHFLVYEMFVHVRVSPNNESI